MKFSSTKSNNERWFILGIVVLLMAIMTVVYIWYNLIHDRAAQERQLRNLPTTDSSLTDKVDDKFAVPQQLEQAATAPEILNSKNASIQSKLGQPMDTSILR